MVKCLPTMWETWVWSLGQEDPLEKEMATHSRTLGKSHGRKSLVVYTPWGCKESDTTELLNFHFHFLNTVMKTHWKIVVFHTLSVKWFFNQGASKISQASPHISLLLVPPLVALNIFQVPVWSDCHFLRIENPWTGSQRGCFIALLASCCYHYHKLVAWKDTNLLSYSLVSQKFHMIVTGLKPKCHGSALFLQTLEEHLFTWIFQLLEATHLPWLLAPSSIFTGLPWWLRQ